MDQKFPCQHVSIGPDPAALQKKYEYAGSNMTYEGWGLPGAATSEASWCIIYRTFDGNGSTLTEQYSNGVPKLNVKWDDRAATTYK